jgi:recombination protein RecT
MTTKTAPAPTSNVPATTKDAATQLGLVTDSRQTAFKMVLEGTGFQAALRSALPRHVRPERIIRVVLSAMTSNPDILECDPNTVILSIMRAASMGLEPDGGPLGQGYLVPFWNSKRRCKECQFIPGYRGLVKLARNSGEVEDVWAKVVYETDDFEFDELNNTPTRHRRNYDLEEPGKMIGAYAGARFRSGYTRYEYMPAREILSVKARTASKTKEGVIVGPWKDHEGEMWKKTVVRRLSKMLPLSAEVASVVTDETDATPITIPPMNFPQIMAPEPPADDSENDLSEPSGDADPPPEEETRKGRKRETSPDGADVPGDLH